MSEPLVRARDTIRASPILASMALNERIIKIRNV